MTRAPLQLPDGDQPSRLATIRRWVLHTFTGRAMALGALLKVVALALSTIWSSQSSLQVLDTLGDVALVTGAAVLAWRLFVDIKRRVLWRVRRKLTLSYIFIGFVPALLLVVFFLLCGVLLLYNVSSHLIQSRVDELVAESDLLARMAASAVGEADTLAAAAAVLARQQATAASRYPQVSYALVPAERGCATPGRGTVGGGAALPPAGGQTATAGPWTHTSAPTHVRSWVPCEGHAGVTFYVDESRRSGDRAPGRLSPRAVARPGGAMAAYGVVVDIPMTKTLTDRLRADTGISLLEVGVVSNAGGTLVESAPPRQPDERRDVGADTAQVEPAAEGVRGFWRRPFRYVAFFDWSDWESGETGKLTVGIESNLAELYERITPAERVGSATLGQILLFLLMAVGALLLVIQLIALAMGLGLARSITGSVHELFVGTERVRRGDFTHKIAIRSRDQLGELAASFNDMTTSIDELLHQKAEKERLEQELRIARNIQMSLLPQGGFARAGFALTAHCEPAREVGGDYYDYLPIDDGRLGILIADVSGKGTSAALYMAELKGIVLSLSRMHASPRELLIDANRILSHHLDSRSFITMTYAVADLQTRTLRYARAGHCPLIYLPGHPGADPVAQVLAPDGMVLGLQLDDGETFARLLEEATLPLGPGDLFLLYTDGITETMNPIGDMYGDDRLASVVSDHAHLAADELREHILRDVRAFAGPGVQQDDMTMVLLKVDGIAAAASLA